MVDRFTETLCLAVAGVQKCFPFEICRKTTRLADLEISQFWIDRAAVYGHAANQHINQSLNSIGRFASNTVPRRIAMRRNSTFWRDSCRKHVASVRGEWWQTVCCLVPPARRITSRELVRELEADLATFADQRMSQVRFRNETANLLGPLQFDDEARQRYLEIVNELFGADQSPVLDSQRMDLITAKWRGWMSGLARHRGNNLEKQILDAISYESRAAIHCCYSTVWCCLLPRLARTYRFPEESFRFHQFWHLDHCRKSNDENDLFHLFHGHVFALHPALGQFLRTTTGPRLMASWLRNPESEEDYQRLLNGLFVAIGQYDRWRGRLRQVESQQVAPVMPVECRNDMNRSEDGIAVRLPIRIART